MNNICTILIHCAADEQFDELCFEFGIELDEVVCGFQAWIVEIADVGERET